MDSFDVQKRIVKMPCSIPTDIWWDEEGDHQGTSKRYAETVSSRFDDQENVDMRVIRTAIRKSHWTPPSVKATPAQDSSQPYVHPGVRPKSSRPPPAPSPRGTNRSQMSSRASSADSTQDRAGRQPKRFCYGDQGSQQDAKYEEQGRSRSRNQREYPEWVKDKWSSATGDDWNWGSSSSYRKN